MLQFLEFFSGIGGFHAASGELVSVAGAWDQDSTANQVYELNHGLRPSSRNLESVTPAELERYRADGWFLSPPCQPYTQKGAQRGIEDPRARPLLHLLQLVPLLRPRFVLLENVPPFEQSATRLQLVQVLRDAGLCVREVLLCPTQLHIPNRRKRYFLLASAKELPEIQLPAPWPPEAIAATLPRYLDEAPADELYLPQGFLETYGKGLDVAQPQGAVTACFGSSYGRARAHSGSYLLSPQGLRRFSPEEIVRLLAFPDSFRFPPQMPLLDRYRLAGNSVNVACLRFLLETLVRNR